MMLRFSSRPTEGRAAYEARVQIHIREVEIRAQNNDWQGVAAYIDAHQSWRSGVKRFFAEFQNLKCGYCERFVTDYSDVEHFRPKTAIFTLQSAGQELPSENRIRGRKFRRFNQSNAWDSGYWWLAYSWDNYLMACGRCNQQWKNALFPVEGGHPRRPRQGDEVTQQALLLNPYNNVEPENHLEYLAGGAIRPLNGSVIGRETITTCGLDRRSLVRSRHSTARFVWRKLNQLLDIFIINGQNSQMRPILEDVWDHGAEDAPNAGMVRIMFVQTTGWTWQQLEDFINQ